MSEPPSDLSDIRQTGDDAERLLRSLDQTDRGEHAQISSVQSGDIPSNPTDGDDASQADREDRSAHPLLIVLIVAIILAPVIVLLWSGSRPSGVAREAALRWQPSCGSSSSPSGRWWPVLGPSSRSVLNRVKRNYCGDAYLNAGGSVQVASFGTREAAERFRDRISEASGLYFRVGSGR